MGRPPGDSGNGPARSRPDPVEGPGRGAVLRTCRSWSRRGRKAGPACAAPLLLPGPEGADHADEAGIVRRRHRRRAAMRLERPAHRGGMRRLRIGGRAAEELGDPSAAPAAPVGGAGDIAADREAAAVEAAPGQAAAVVGEPRRPVAERGAGGVAEVVDAARQADILRVEIRRQRGVRRERAGGAVARPRRALRVQAGGGPGVGRGAGEGVELRPAAGPVMVPARGEDVGAARPRGVERQGIPLRLVDAVVRRVVAERPMPAAPGPGRAWARPRLEEPAGPVSAIARLAATRVRPALRTIRSPPWWLRPKHRPNASGRRHGACRSGRRR